MERIERHENQAFINITVIRNESMSIVNFVIEN